MTLAMTRTPAVQRESLLCLKHMGVSLVGFGVDAVLLHLCVRAGMEAAWARLISLLCAMQVTFVLNGLHVFKSLERRHLPRQWLAYMASNGLGNICNYWIFVTLVSLHWGLVSNPLFALGVGSLSAWVINYATARLLVFRKLVGSIDGPARDGRGSARR